MTDNYEVIPLTPMRKVIAARMLEAKRTIPHFRVSRDFEIDSLLTIRHSLRERARPAQISLNDLFVKACATALMDVPAVNVQWVESEIRQFRTADISVVIAVEGGLATPIIHRAETKSVSEISRELQGLVIRAGTNALKMSEVLGGSFSVSNLGMHGVDAFDAIINPPQCAILAISAAKPRLVVTPERQTRIATMATMTLSVDHRAIDGVIAAKFMSALQRRVEDLDYLSSGK